MAKFQFNVVDMCNKMMSDYELIIDRGGQNNDTVLGIYTALLSDKNNVFNHCFERSTDHLELRAAMTYDLVITPVKKYNNMVEQGRWK